MAIYQRNEIVNYFWTAYSTIFSNPGGNWRKDGKNIFTMFENDSISTVFKAAQKVECK